MRTPVLTIFTPAYNRAHLLPRLYASLCRQTNQNFIWLVVDDGSTDDTQVLVRTWIDEGKLSIRYAYKENGGMHTAHNLAYELIDTELNTCIDSDDYMPDNAVELILNTWLKRSDERYAGIIGLDITESGELIGTKFDKDVTTLSNFYAQGGRGDKKLVYRTDLMKTLPPYPIFEGEKYVGLGYKYLLLDRTHHLITLNEPLAVIDYQQDGSSNTIIRQNVLNPKGFAFIHRSDLIYHRSWKRIVKSGIHLTADLLLQNKINVFRESPRPLLTFLTLPFGILCWCYILYQYKKNQ